MPIPPYKIPGLSDALTSLSDATSHFAPNLNNWLRKGVSGKTVYCWGDSTTSNAATLFTELAFFQNGAEALAGTTILNRGNNGASLAAALTPGGVTYDIADAIAAAADLYVLSWLINDVRLGLVSEAQAAALLTRACQTLHAGVPGADIVLRTPLAFLSDDPTASGFVTGSAAVPNHGTVGVDGANQLAANAQFYSTLIRNAYLRVANTLPYVVLLDTQASVSGTACRPAAGNPDMTDILHPNAAGQTAVAAALKALVGSRLPFSAEVAANARATNYAQDYTLYQRACEDAGYYDLIAQGRWVDQGSGFLTFTWPQTRRGEITFGDIVVMADKTGWAVPQGFSAVASGAFTRLTGMGAGNPPVTITGGTVSVYRHRYQGASAAETYWKQYLTYPYRWKGYGADCGAGYARIAAMPGEVLAKNRTGTVAADTIVFEDGTTVTGFSVVGPSGNLLQLNSGTFTAALLNKRCVVFGNHAYENGSLFRLTGTELPWVQAN